MILVTFLEVDEKIKGLFLLVLTISSFSLTIEKAITGLLRDNS